ncbi:MAG: xanthine phosphoribosyltransferase [Clostridia bacterium]|nr:xanthine phosphoribosyltransferase [Clostridia bacterium]
MKLLEEKILSDGIVLPGGVLKVDNFLNHQIDPVIVTEMGKEFFRLFGDKKVDKIVTVESSGISIAFAAAQCFGVPVVFAKKGFHKNVGTDVYSAQYFSFTKGDSTEISISKRLLSEGEHILIIDDFLANGAAADALIQILQAAGAVLTGIGIAIEKGFQPGGASLRQRGVPVRSLAIIDTMTDDSITFRDDVQ